MRFDKWFAALAAFALVSAGTATVEAREKPKKVKYAKSELDKAVGKCVGTVLGGALLGALIAGKKDRTEGALAGAAAGGVLCAVIVNNAKKKDRMLRAQLAAAESRNGKFRETYIDDDGTQVTLTATAGAVETIPVSRLIPVKAKLSDGTEMVSPVLAGPDGFCRTSAVSLQQNGGELVRAPDQRTCRDENGDYWPYDIRKA